MEFVFGFTGSQDQPAKAEQGHPSDPTQGDQKVQTESRHVLDFIVGTNQTVQLDDTHLKAVVDLLQANQDANPQVHAEHLTRWARSGDGMAWFAVQSDRSSGISLAPVDDSLRSHLKLPKDQGLLVTGIDPQSPAASAGLHQNDVLLKLGDAPLGKPEDLDAALKAAGDKPVVLHFYRDGSAKKLPVQPQVQITFGPVPVRPPAPQFWIGVSVADVEPALRAQLRMPAGKGLLVNEVFKDSPAEKGGLKVNDILLSLNGKPLAEQKTLVELVQANGEKTVTLELMREGQTQGDVEITPQRRKPTPTSDGSGRPNLYTYQLARPGVLLKEPSPYLLQLRDLTANAALHDTTKDRQLKDPNAALSKRLDELDAELKKLVKLHEELAKSLKVQEIELLFKKLSSDKK